MNLQELREFGFGHSGIKPGVQELAHFCAACPQPGINLPENWKEDVDASKYHRGYVLDGNFVNVHQASLVEEKDVWLKSGESFMVERTRYEEHLVSTTERKEVCTRSEFCCWIDRLT